MSERETSTVVIVLRNSLLDDGDLLCAVVARTLREYLEMLECGRGGNEQQETFVSGNGTEVSVMAVSSAVVGIPREEPLCLTRRAGVLEER